MQIVGFNDYDQATSTAHASVLAAADRVFVVCVCLFVVFWSAIMQPETKLCQMLGLQLCKLP